MRKEERGLMWIVVFVLLGVAIAMLLTSCGGMAMREGSAELKAVVLWDVHAEDVQGVDKNVGRVMVRVNRDPIGEVDALLPYGIDAFVEALSDGGKLPWLLVEMRYADHSEWVLEMSSEHWY